MELGDITTFDGYRRDATGEVREFRVDLRDEGPAFEDDRWTVTATDKHDGTAVQGDARGTIEDALSTIRWDDHWPRPDPE
jgi:hypothetical protein